MLPRLYRTEYEIRKRQINTLKIFNDNVTEFQEGSEYHVPFNVAGTEFCVRVLLTTEFPNEKPILRISPVVIHPWVSAEGDITSAPGLLNYTIHSDLGRVVQAIIREFERNPPPLASDQPRSTITSPSIPAKGLENENIMGRGSPNYCLNYSGLQNFSPSAHSSTITYSTAFPQLNSLSLDELKFLNECSERREEFIDNLPQVKETNKAIDDLISNIEELADSNLSKRERFNQLNKDTKIKTDKVMKLAFENERLNAMYQTLSEKYSPKNIKDQLRDMSEKSHSESEQVVDAFLNGKLDVDKFVSSYIQIRTLSQARKTKEEKLSQQLRNLEKAGF